jgi:hypothetical protein
MEYATCPQGIDKDLLFFPIILSLFICWKVPFVKMWSPAFVPKPKVSNILSHDFDYITGFFNYKRTGLILSMLLEHLWKSQ